MWKYVVNLKQSEGRKTDMIDKDIEEKLGEIFTDINEGFSVVVDQKDKNIKDLVVFDSVSALTVICNIDEKFNIETDFNLFSQYSTFSDIVKYISERINYEN